MVESKLHGDFVGENPPPFSLYYALLDPKQCTTVVIPKQFGSISATRPVEPQKIDLTSKKLFFNTLQESIEKEGFRNPIICWHTDKLYCLYGTSRLYIAQRIRMPIPAFILDFSGTLIFRSDIRLEEIETEEQALSKFKDKPTVWKYRENYFNFVNERWPYDPSVRKANNLPQDKLTKDEIHMASNSS